MGLMRTDGLSVSYAVLSCAAQIRFFFRATKMRSSYVSVPVTAIHLLVFNCLVSVSDSLLIAYLFRLWICVFFCGLSGRRRALVGMPMSSWTRTDSDAPRIFHEVGGGLCDIFACTSRRPSRQVRHMDTTAQADALTHVRAHMRTFQHARLGSICWCAHSQTWLLSACLVRVFGNLDHRRYLLLDLFRLCVSSSAFE